MRRANTGFGSVLALALLCCAFALRLSPFEPAGAEAQRSDAPLQQRLENAPGEIQEPGPIQQAGEIQDPGRQEGGGEPGRR